MAAITQAIASGMAKLSNKIANNPIGQVAGLTAITNKTVWGPEEGIKDKTSDNLGTEIINPIEQTNALKEAIKLRDEEWARADAIRKETQKREDTAYSRGIQDLRNSGVNVNLLGNVSAAPTGGGITNETGSVNYAMAEKEYQAQIDLLMQEIEQNFQGDQAEKDRIKDIIKSVITAGALLGGAGIKAAGK